LKNAKKENVMVSHFIFLIFNDLLHSVHAGLNWILENPRIEYIPRVQGWITSYCFIRYLTKAHKKIFQYHREFREKKDLHRHVLKKLDYFQDPFISSVIGRPATRYVSATEILYIITRILEPKTVVETGVASGISSTYILQALKDNGRGELYSIDISTQIPRDTKQVGWIIPQELRYRWHLIRGSSSEKLLPLLKSLGKIDIFLHDSLHTYENMLWEYKTVWHFIRRDGILLSHDIQLNKAFSDFCDSIKGKDVSLGNLGGISKCYNEKETVW